MRAIKYKKMYINANNVSNIPYIVYYKIYCFLNYFCYSVPKSVL